MNLVFKPNNKTTGCFKPSITLLAYSGNKWGSYVKGLISIILLTFFVAGCANRGIQVSQEELTSYQDPTWLNHQRAVQNIQSWEAKGKVAASKQGEGGSASFVWEQHRDTFKVRMFGPFGAGSAELSGSDNQVVFEEGDGTKLVAEHPEEILYKATGLYIPVTGLRHWIKGIPAPQIPTRRIKVNVDGQLVYLEQSGWRIEYQNYREEHGQWLPTRLNLSRDGMLVKLIVKQWALGR